MAEQPKELVFAEPLSPLKTGYPGFNPHSVKTGGMVIDYDVAIPMRDGVKIYADVYRPDMPGRFPPLIQWGPYGKHGATFYNFLGNCGVHDEDFNEFCRFEAADPLYWTRYGYVVINVDSRGSWWSEGDLTWMSEQEVEDMYDAIEWAGTREWSNGKVGMQGVSYLAWSQWKVAAANPPHLAAINPWEGSATSTGNWPSTGASRRRCSAPCGRATSTTRPPGSKTSWPCRTRTRSSTSTGRARTPTSPR
jgi:putative CocE/NonD family hydrolase